MVTCTIFHNTFASDLQLWRLVGRQLQLAESCPCCTVQLFLFWTCHKLKGFMGQIENRQNWPDSKHTRHCLPHTKKVGSAHNHSLANSTLFSISWTFFSSGRHYYYHCCAGSKRRLSEIWRRKRIIRIIQPLLTTIQKWIVYTCSVAFSPLHVFCIWPSVVPSRGDFESVQEEKKSLDSNI